jgi:hypothetical protein
MENKPKGDKPPPEHQILEVETSFNEALRSKLQGILAKANELGACCFFCSAEETAALFRKGIEFDRLK